MRLLWVGLMTGLVLGGCASYKWMPIEGQTQEKFSKAHTDCQAKAGASGLKRTGFANVLEWNSFMKECMDGHGWKLED